MKIANFFGIFRDIFYLLEKRQKFQFVLLVFWAFFISLFELFCVAILLPFINFIVQPKILNTGYYKIVYDYLGFTDHITFIAAFGIFVIVIYLFRGVITLLSSYIFVRWTRFILRSISKKIFYKISYLPWVVYVQKNTSDYVQLMRGEVGRVSETCFLILQILAGVLTLTIFYLFILISNWRFTLVITVVLAIIIAFINLTIFKRIKKLGKSRVDAEMGINRVLLEMFGNFKFTRLRGREKIYGEKFGAYLYVSEGAEILARIFDLAQILILETTGISLLIASFVFVLWADNSTTRILPLVAMYAIVLYRCLPLLGKMLQLFNRILYCEHSIGIVRKELQQEVVDEGNDNLSFNEKIVFENVSFKYNTGEYILRNISLTIKKGEKIGIIGVSGRGKSTLMDILIGIIEPTNGAVLIDEQRVTNANVRSWRKRIGYVPQSIYLYDGTVEENIVFGSEYDEKRVIDVLKIACIWDFFEKKDGVKTLVGEGGIRLSGGQKQRVGIARALYFNPDVLVFDEATSALNAELEAKVMDAIYEDSDNKTMIVVAHRLSTLERCERRFVVEGGEIIVK